MTRNALTIRTDDGDRLPPAPDEGTQCRFVHLSVFLFFVITMRRSPLSSTTHGGPSVATSELAQRRRAFILRGQGSC